MATLSSAQFSPYIEIRSTLTLTDARYFEDEKYTTNQNFKQQLEVADVIIANKSDVASKPQMDGMYIWLQSNDIDTNVIAATRGDIELSLLDAFVKPNQDADIEEHHHHHAALEPQFQLPPDQSHIRKENKGQGYFSCGWLFGAEMVFSFDDLFSMLNDLTADRVKAVMNTDQGCYVFNKAGGVLSVNALTLEGFESRIEVIDTQLMPWGQLEEVLLKLVTKAKS